MDVTPELEAPREPGSSSSEAVTVAFGDRSADVYGIARVGLSAEDGGERTASGLGLLFSGGEPVAVRAEGGVGAEAEGWGGADVAGVRTDVLEPLRSWTVRFSSEDRSTGFELSLTARSQPAALGADAPAAKLGGMEGYEQLVQVNGAVMIGGASKHVDCLGQRGHSWGAPDWERLSLARTLGVWLEGGVGVTLTSVRPAKARDHEHEATAAYLLGAGADGLGEATPVADPRLSTTYDEDGRQQRAGLELFVGEDDDFPHRAAGEVLCGTTLDLGRMRLDTAFFEWRMDGRRGVGRYDLLRRT